MKKMTRKEILFALYYAQDRNGRIAAAKAGYHQPLQNAVRLLRREDIRKAVAEHSTYTLSEDEIIAGYRKLAFGTGADALRLLFSDAPSEVDFDALDLFNIAEIKKPKDGALEIKFFDRLKALEHLEDLATNTEAQSAMPFLEALMHSVPSSDEKQQEADDYSLI